MMSKTYAEAIACDRRRVLLEAVDQAPGSALRETVLLRLLEGERLAIDADGLREDFRWLADRGLLTIEYHDGVQAVRISARGQDVAADRLRIEGIARGRL